MKISTAALLLTVTSLTGWTEGSALCDYLCSINGVCTVTYTGQQRTGPTIGYCFPRSFGGSCGGTPPECQDCKKAINCSENVAGPSNFPPHTPKPKPGSEPQNNSQPNPPPAVNQTGSPPCNYRCLHSGSCTVTYTGHIRTGLVAGSCFSKSFGGGCAGTPSECEDCNTAIDCSENEAEPSNKPNPNSQPIDNHSGSPPCNYQCSNGGACTVTYTGQFRSGATYGSCFPSRFGGGCSGTPLECQDCNKAINCSEYGTGPPNHPPVSISAIPSSNAQTFNILLNLLKPQPSLQPQGHNPSNPKSNEQLFTNLLNLLKQLQEKIRKIKVSKEQNVL